ARLGSGGERVAEEAPQRGGSQTLQGLVGEFVGCHGVLLREPDHRAGAGAGVGVGVHTQEMSSNVSGPRDERSMLRRVAPMPSRWQISPKRRALVWMRVARSRRRSAYAAKASAGSALWPRAWPSATASSSAWQAPCARYWSMGWAASPRSAIRPCTQVLIGARSYSGQRRSRETSGSASRTARQPP